ncbi:MAG: hypothetical protein EOP49_18175, partial [Sphingobacteriales bacterium]
MKKTLLALMIAGSLSAVAQKKSDKAAVIKPKKEFVADLLSRMTLEEKLGQLNLPTSDDFTTGQGGSTN